MAEQKIDRGQALELVLDSVRVDAAAADLNRQGIKPGLNWAALRQLALRQGVMPLVYKRLESLPAAVVPAGEMARWRDIFLTNAAQNVRLTRKLIQVLDLLEGQGIEAVPFKGPELAVRAYGDTALRSLGDLDILIRNRDFERVYEVMEGAGYRSNFPAIGGMKRLWERSGRDFLFLDQTAIYDFHQRLHQGHRKFRISEEVWHNLARVQLLSRRVPVLGAEDTLLMLTVHAAKHSWQPLKWLVDVAHFAAAQPGLDWSRLFVRAEHMGCRRILAITLCLSRDLTGLTLPPQVGERVCRDPKALKLAARFKGEILVGQRPSQLAEFMGIPQTLDTPVDKIRYVGYYLLTPSALDLAVVRLPVALYPLYTLIRPFRQLFKYLYRLFKVRRPAR
jgi:hypothetical protein